MGTIAARDASRVITLTEQVIAALSCAAVQAVKLKGVDTELSPVLTAFQHWVLQSFTYVAEDRPLQQELQTLVNRFDHLELLRQHCCSIFIGNEHAC